MTGQDAELGRYIRREFARRPIDSTRLEIQVVGGRIYLSGTLANLRSQPQVNLQEEVALVEKLISGHRDAKGVFNQCRYTRQRAEEKETHGPHRIGHRQR